MIMDWRNVKDVSIGGKAAKRVLLNSRVIWEKGGPEPIPTGNAKFVSTTIKPGNANNVWTDGTYLYYSTSGSEHYRYDKTSNTWSSISIPGCGDTGKASDAIWGFDGRVFWNDGYELNKETMRWERASFSGSTGTFYGGQTWSDGENVYYTGSGWSSGNTYILDKDTFTWSRVTSITQSLGGRYFWTDGENIYYSAGSTNYIFDKETKTLSTISWNRTNSNSGNRMWTDGRDIFMSDSSTHWILDKENRQWNIKTWSGISPSSGGQYIYCMNPLKNAQAKCRCSTFGTDRTFNALVDKVIYTGTAAEITYVEE